MSQFCPLCGKTKLKEPLFCDDCVKKIHAEYEVEIPKETAAGGSSVAEDLPVKNEVGMESGVGGVSESEKTEKAPEPQKELPNRKVKITGPLTVITVITFLVAAFFVYNSTIRKANMDRDAWNVAVGVNSVEGYLAYMEAYPRGVHFDEAQEGLLGLKSEEASLWEKMKGSGNATELRDFLHRYPKSPYVPLVETKLDSVVWAGALRLNTMESVSNYVRMAENGEIAGDYIGEARNVYELLSMPQPADTIALDSLFETTFP